MEMYERAIEKGGHVDAMFNVGTQLRSVVQYRALQGGWKEKKLSGNDKLFGLGDTRVNNCTVVIFNYLILFS